MSYQNRRLSLLVAALVFSGFTGITAFAQVNLEPNTNRPGLDYKDFDLPDPAREPCQEACAADPNCRAYTYVKPGVQGAKAHCWLKSGVPPPVKDSCCTSGVKTLPQQMSPRDLPSNQSNNTSNLPMPPVNVRVPPSLVMLPLRSTRRTR